MSVIPWEPILATCDKAGYGAVHICLLRSCLLCTIVGSVHFFCSLPSSVITCRLRLYFYLYLISFRCLHKSYYYFKVHKLGSLCFVRHVSLQPPALSITFWLIYQTYCSCPFTSSVWAPFRLCTTQNFIVWQKYYDTKYLCTVYKLICVGNRRIKQRCLNLSV